MSKKPARTRQITTANYYDSEENSYDLRLSEEFKTFEQTVESVLTAVPQSIGAIRKILATDNYYWLSLALESLIVVGKAKLFPGLIDKYASDSKVISPLPKIDRAAYHGNFLCK